MFFDCFVSFLKNKAGNIAIVFSLTLIPIMVLGGAAIDFNKRESEEARLQSAVDATTIATAKWAIGVKSKHHRQIKKVAKRYLATMYQGNEIPTVNAAISDEGKLVVTASSTSETSLLSLIGIQELTTKAHAETVIYDDGRKVEAVLVLDTSYSMTGERIEALKTASKFFVNQLIREETSGTRIGIVPFNSYVSVGENPPRGGWLKRPSDQSVQYCVPTSQDYLDAGCTWGRTTCDLDGVIQSCDGWRCPDGVTPNNTCTIRNERFWGTVINREPPLDVLDERFRGVNKIDGVIGPTPRTTEILPLTNDVAKLEDHIDSLYIHYGAGTYMAPGISWGARVLSSREPYNDGMREKNMKPTDRKVMIIISDGKNENSRLSNGWPGGEDIVDANRTTRDACMNAKTDSTEVYTVALIVDDQETLDILQECATDISYFSDIDDADELQDVFTGIALEVNQLRLTR